MFTLPHEQKPKVMRHRCNSCRVSLTALSVQVTWTMRVPANATVTPVGAAGGPLNGFTVTVTVAELLSTPASGPRSGYVNVVVPKKAPVGVKVTLFPLLTTEPLSG